jgi:hypothetical protein
VELLEVMDSRTKGTQRLTLVVDNGRIVGAWRWARYYPDWRDAEVTPPFRPVAYKGSNPEPAQSMATRAADLVAVQCSEVDHVTFQETHEHYRNYGR